MYINAEKSVLLLLFDWPMLNISAEAPAEAEGPTVYDYTDEQLQLLVS
jgi:hypothetical protein